MKGVEYGDSFDFNPHKWMMVNSDCSAMWVKDAKDLVDAFSVERIYLQHKHEKEAADLRHWQISLGRRFRALKLWFVLRIYGVDGIRNHIRAQVGLARHFQDLVNGDERFEVCTYSMGLVCFRLRGPDHLTKDLHERLTERRNIYVIPCHVNAKFVIRFVICSRVTNESDIDFAWKEIGLVANGLVPCKTVEMKDNSFHGEFKKKIEIDVKMSSIAEGCLERAK